MDDQEYNLQDEGQEAQSPRNIDEWREAKKAAAEDRHEDSAGERTYYDEPEDDDEDDGATVKFDHLETLGLNPKDIVNATNTYLAKKMLEPQYDEEWWDDEEYEARARQVLDTVGGYADEAIAKLKDNPEFKGMKKERQNIINMMMRNPTLPADEAFKQLKASKAAKSNADPTNAKLAKDAEKMGISVKEAQRLMSSGPVRDVYEWRERNKAKSGGRR